MCSGGTPVKWPSLWRSCLPKSTLVACVSARDYMVVCQNKVLCMTLLEGLWLQVSLHGNIHWFKHQNSYKTYYKFMSSRLPNQTSPNHTFFFTKRELTTGLFRKTLASSSITRSNGDHT